jgi:hypothetical protein
MCFFKYMIGMIGAGLAAMAAVEGRAATDGAATAPAPAAAPVDGDETASDWEGVEQPDDEPNPFAKTYSRYELTRTFPVSFSEQALAPGEPQPAFAYLHDLDRHWLMGLSAGYKLLARRDLPAGPAPDHWLALWTVAHETDYVVRLSHPYYLMLGPKLIYILPCKSGKLPIERVKDYDAEVGGAISVQLARVLAGGSILSLRFDRWRGTSSMRLHGIEIAAGVSFAWK